MVICVTSLSLPGTASEMDATIDARLACLVHACQLQRPEQPDGVGDLEVLCWPLAFAGVSPAFRPALYQWEPGLSAMGREAAPMQMVPAQG